MDVDEGRRESETMNNVSCLFGTAHVHPSTWFLLSNPHRQILNWDETIQTTLDEHRKIPERKV